MAITDPRDIPGLVAWYSAEAEAGYADGAVMTGWTDLSGNGNHATAAGTTGPLWQATSSEASGPAVRFQGTGFFALPASLMASASAGEVMLKIKADGGNCGLWRVGEYLNSGDNSHYTYNGTVYDSFGLAGGGGQRVAFGVGSITGGVSVWRNYNVWVAATGHDHLLDGTSMSAYSGALTVGWDAAPLLGADVPAPGSDTVFVGHMSTVVLFDRKLTTTERADLSAWLVANPSGGTASPSSIVVAGESWASPSTMLDGLTKTGVRVAGESWASPAAMLDGAILDTAPVVVSGEPWTVTAAMLDGTPTLGPLVVTGEPWAVSAEWVEGFFPGQPVVVVGEPWSVPATLLDGAVPQRFTTVTTDKVNGRQRSGRLNLRIVNPLGEDATDEGLPASEGSTVRLHKQPYRIISPSLPPPTLVDGRPQ